MPDFRKLIQERLTAENLHPTQESSLIDELAQHLEDLYTDCIARGMSAEEAFRTAADELQAMPAVRTHMARHDAKPQYADTPGEPGRGSWFDQLHGDLRYAVRGMAKHPFFTLFAVLTLALGTGANATVFTVVNTLILNPLPVRSISELMDLEERRTANSSGSDEAQPLSLPNLDDVAARNKAFNAVAGYTSPRIMTWDEGDVPQRIFADFVTGNYFSVLGLRPARGRFFEGAEDARPAAHAVAVLNYATWQTRFGGDERILNRMLRINNVPVTIIGVAPPSFLGVNAVFGPDLWLPAGMVEQMLPVEMKGALTDRSKAVFKGVARLLPNKTKAEAEANLSTIHADLAREFPNVNEGRELSVKPVRDVLLGDTPVALAGVLLLAVAGIVLLIACFNVANLLMARAVARQGEMAIRIALGASRRRLLRQLVTESMVLAVAAATAGAWLGYEGAQLLWSFREAQWSANLVSPKFDASVVLYTFALSVAAGFVFGTLPALQAYQACVSATLKDNTRAAGKTRNSSRLSRVLLSSQVAFSAVVLVATSLFVRSIEKTNTIDPGFEPHHLGIVMANPGQAGYTDAQVRSFYREVKRRVAAMPGVEAVSWASTMPLWNAPVSGFEIEGRAARSRSDTVISVLHTVDVDYFQAAGIRLSAGRVFQAADREESAPVAIVNEKLAREYWPNEGATGKLLMIPGEKQWRVVVGVASNANYSSLGESPQPAVYVPLEQHPQSSMVLYFRSRAEPGELLGPVQRDIRSIGPQVSSDDARTCNRIMEQATIISKIAVTMLTVFGLLALALASVGLYGNVAFAVQSRRREIGVRMALGASPGSVVGLILRQGMVPVVIGLALGLTVSLLAGRVLANLLYGISASDALSYAASTLVLLVVGVIACSIPAWSASHVDPLTTLRDV